MIRFLKILIINITILVFGIVFIELFFGSWFKKINYSNLLIPRYQTNLINDFPYENHTLGIYSRDKNGFRANQYDLHQVNILVLGGSTTEERDVDDNKIWTKVFEKNLNNKYLVLNAGIGGQTSYGHKSMFDMWFSRYPELVPEYILVYLGINDSLYLAEYLNENSILFNGRQMNSSNRDTLIHINFTDRIIQYIKNNSIFHSLYLIVKGNILSNKYKLFYDAQPLQPDSYKDIFSSSVNDFDKEKNKNILVLDEDKLVIFTKYFYQNLNEIVKYSNNYNSKTIFITQVISKKHWLTNYLREINNLTLIYCKKQKIKCINLDSTKLKLDEKNFYDGIHTTPNGSKIIGEFLAKKFNNLD
jgi:lysophospholipase L1-like esterase